MKPTLGLLIIACLASACTTKYPEDHLETFRPVAEYARVQRIAGPGAELHGLTATKVKSDGVMNLLATYAPEVTYRFVQADVPLVAPEAPPVTEAAPIGSGIVAPTVEPARVRFNMIDVLIKKPFRVSRQAETKALHRSYASVPISADILPTLLPAPTCTLDQLWATAKKHGVPDNAVADITYGSEYRFTIDELEIDLRFDHQCQLIGYLKILATNRRASRSYVYVTIDGEDRGIMKFRLDEGNHGIFRVGSFGSHTLVVRHDRFGTKTQTINLEPGTLPTIAFEF